MKKYGNKIWLGEGLFLSTDTDYHIGPARIFHSPHLLGVVS